MEKLNRPQAVSLLCSDDIVKNPGNGRLVRITELVEGSGAYLYFNGRDYETGEITGLRFRKSSRVTVWID